MTRKTRGEDVSVHIKKKEQARNNERTCWFLFMKKKKEQAREQLQLGKKDIFEKKILSTEIILICLVLNAFFSSSICPRKNRFVIEAKK